MCELDTKGIKNGPICRITYKFLHDCLNCSIRLRSAEDRLGNLDSWDRLYLINQIDYQVYILGCPMFF